MVGELASGLAEALQGTLAFVRGMLAVFAALRSNRFWSQPDLKLKLAYTPLAIGCVLLVACLLMACITPFLMVHQGMIHALTSLHSKPGPRAIVIDHWGNFLKYLGWSSMLYLVAYHLHRPFLRALFPELLSGTSLFFDTLAMRDQEVAEKLRQRPIQASKILKARLLKKFKAGSAVFVLVAALVAILLTFAAPVLAAVAAAMAAIAAVFIAIGPLVLCGGAALLVAVLATLGLCGYVMVLLNPFIKMLRFDPLLGVALLVVGLCVGFTQVSTAITTAVRLYYTASLLTEQLLVDYHERLDDESGKEWEEYSLKKRWKLVGFGLPLWGITLVAHPFFLIAGLQIFQGAASMLLLETFERSALLEDP